MSVWPTALYHQQDSLLLHVLAQPIKIHYLILNRIQIGDTSLTLHRAHKEPQMVFDPYSIGYSLSGRLITRSTHVPYRMKISMKSNLLTSIKIIEIILGFFNLEIVPHISRRHITTYTIFYPIYISHAYNTFTEYIEEYTSTYHSLNKRYRAEIHDT